MNKTRTDERLDEIHKKIITFLKQDSEYIKQRIEKLNLENELNLPVMAKDLKQKITTLSDRDFFKIVNLILTYI